MSNTIKVKGLNELSRKLNNINRKLKKYDGTHNISLSVSQEQWNNMTDSQRDRCIEKAKDKFVSDMIKDVFK